MNDRNLNRTTRQAILAGAAALMTAALMGVLTAANAQAPAVDTPKSEIPANQPSRPVPPAASPSNPPIAPGAKSDAGPRPDAAAQAGDLTGLAVVDRQGKRIGSVAKVDRLPNGQVKGVEISTGGFLGLGSKTLKVDGETIERSGQRVVLLLSAEQIEKLTQ